jgi:hypothetical protein
MKIGAVYSVFNSEELLEKSIESIKDSVDFIALVYQVKSNYGKINNNALKVVEDLYKRKMVNQIYRYEPYVLENDLKVSGIFNTLKKRNLGLEVCRDMDCTHFLSMDCDEFYIKEEFEKAKEIIKQGDYDSSFCQMETYYKYPTCQLRPQWAGYFVPFLYKIRKGIAHEFIENWDTDLFVDNCRRQEKGNHYVFSRNELQMHHYSYLRKDIRSKYENTEYTTLLNPEWINKIENDYKQFNLKNNSEVSILKSDGLDKSEFRIVDNQFNIEL